MSLQVPLKSREISETRHSLDVGNDTYCETEVVIHSEDMAGDIQDVVMVTRSINDEAIEKTTTTYLNDERVDFKTGSNLSESRHAELESKWKENWKPKTQFLGDKIPEFVID